jgi:hypothetical protein
MDFRKIDPWNGGSAVPNGCMPYATPVGAVIGGGATWGQFDQSVSAATYKNKTYLGKYKWVNMTLCLFGAFEYKNVDIFVQDKYLFWMTFCP